MFRKSIMAVIIATIAAVSMTSAASAKRFKHGWGHQHNFHKHHNHRRYFKKVYVSHFAKRGCNFYRYKWKSTHKRSWHNKYKACLYLNY